MGVHNSETEMLLSAVGSVLSQSVSDIELIICDDGSENGIGKTLDSIKDSRVKLISFEENKEQHTILNDVSLQVEKGEFICLLGPSGCGKSTLLNAMAGFLKPSSGEIKIDGQTVEKPSMKYVTIFQNYGLLPWRSVQKNVELGLETKKLGKEEKRRSQIITWKWLA